MPRMRFSVVYFLLSFIHKGIEACVSFLLFRQEMHVSGARHATLCFHSCVRKQQPKYVSR